MGRRYRSVHAVRVIGGGVRVAEVQTALVRRAHLVDSRTRRRAGLPGELRPSKVRGGRCQMLVPTLLMMVLICPPRKITAAITTIAMRARMRAYSARPCPSSSRADGGRQLGDESCHVVQVPPFPRCPSLDGDHECATRPAGRRYGTSVPDRRAVRVIGRGVPGSGDVWHAAWQLADMKKGGAPGGAPALRRLAEDRSRSSDARRRRCSTWC